MTRLLLIVAIATTACVKQGAVRSEPAFDLRQICTDPHFSTACSPQPRQEAPHPVRIDTNFVMLKQSFSG